MNSEEIERFIALIARENKVVIGSDDPVAMQLTAMRFLLNELASAQEGIVREFRETVATSASDWEKRSQKRAEAVLNAAVLAAKNAVAAGAQEGLAAELPAFREAFAQASRRTDAQLHRSRRLALALVGAAAFLLACQVAVLVVNLLHGPR